MEKYTQENEKVSKHRIMKWLGWAVGVELVVLAIMHFFPCQREAEAIIDQCGVKDLRIWALILPPMVAIDAGVFIAGIICVSKGKSERNWVWLSWIFTFAILALWYLNPIGMTLLRIATN